MRLSRLFALASAVLFLLTCLPLAWIIDGEWSVYQTTHDALSTLQVVQLAMNAAESVSFERGPTNVLLSSPDFPGIGQRLRLVRRDSDQALLALQAALAPSEAPEYRQAEASARQARQLLTLARRDVDAAARLPERDAQRITDAVRRMFEVVPATLQAVSTLSTRAINCHPQLATQLNGALRAAELREYGGRIGSHLTAAMAQHRPLTAQEMQAIDELRGRIFQLRDDIRLRNSLPTTSSATLRAVDRMEASYFRQGLALVDNSEAASRRGQPVPIGTASFVARFVPTLASISGLRDAMMQSALNEARARQDAARLHLVYAVALGVVALLAQLALIGFIRWRVVKPMLTASGLLTDLAHGRLDVAIPTTRRADEVGKVLGAIETLRARSRERHALEQEKQRLIEELTEISRVDFLTGIANRRAFTQAAHAEIARARLHGESATLILFDIDFFKQVNDNYGHDAGDAVLCHIAAIAAQTCRENDLIGRYGGEEFIILAGGGSVGRTLAERLRARIEDAPLRLPSGQTLPVTASFGIASLDTDRHSLEHLLAAADDALYQAKRQGRNRVESVNQSVAD
ncbi:GGDEF domain-containing protein [Chromobacterium alticapitis]|uniref:diguanylate cyclase n=2 Tax=Chromobacterium alticapitis TaxID=2073169 RepID=A0A2S5DFS4_9NEIS|nr:GGDEF domain-containing protein [Chromobacterium alticapitis]